MSLPLIPASGTEVHGGPEISSAIFSTNCNKRHGMVAGFVRREWVDDIGGSASKHGCVLHHTENYGMWLIVQGPFLLTWFTLIPSWMRNHTPNKVWDDIVHPIPNYIGANVEIWKWLSNFIPHLIMDVITYPCWDKNQSRFVKGTPDRSFI